ncbi:Nn.00g104690.m01.CDS01 [Neocucurbitaria sp. VM-36]
MANPTRPPQKRRKLTLPPRPLHLRNGGSANSFIPANSAPYALSPSGSDTEEEDSTDLEQHFLDKMTDDTDQKIQTVFGAGVNVWKSLGGTVYTDLDDGVKSKMREEQLWGTKRKRNDAKGKKGGNDASQVDRLKEVPVVPQGVVTLAQSPLPAAAARSPLQTPMATPTPMIKALTAPAPAIAPYRPRTPHDTQFNRGSAGIDPLGAYNRPIHPLPAARQLGAAADQAPLRRIVSGSFGSFEGGRPGRFDERAYRLGQGTGGGEEGEKGEGKLDVFKGKPWLRRL